MVFSCEPAYSLLSPAVPWRPSFSVSCRVEDGLCFLVVFISATRFCWKRSLVDFSFTFLTVPSEDLCAFHCFCWKFSCQLNFRWLSYGETLFFLLRIRLSFALFFSTLAMPYLCVEHQVLIFLGDH